MAMKPGMKMLAMAKTQGGRMGNYDREMTERPEMRRMEGSMERSGIEGRRMEKSMEARGAEMYGRRMDGEMEMRRRRDERGRYMNDEREGHYRPEPHIPPYQKQEVEEGRDGRMERRSENNMRMRQRESRQEEMTGGRIDYRKADGSSGNVSYFKTKPWQDRENDHQMGFKQNDQHMGGREFDKQTAMEWVESMEDKDGVKGGAYTWHQAQQYGRNMGITGEERLAEFYAVMNAMQSDYWQVAKKFGVDKPEFYACMAKAFIEDPDAVEDKVAMYYECIARKE